MNPTAKKALKIFSYFWLFTGIFLILLIVVINLPFGHVLLTGSTNSFLKSKGFPLTVDRISFYLNGEIGLHNVKLITGDHDTIIFAGDIDVSFEILPLLRKKVVVNNLQLNTAVVNLETDSADVLNLLSFFVKPNNPDQNKSESGSSWEVQLDKSHLQNIRFSYIDKWNGILINQSIANADLTFDHFSLLKKEIDVREIIINKSVGLASIATSKDEKADEDTIPSPWKFSAKKIDLVQMQYRYENPVNHQSASVILKQATLGVEKLDLTLQELIVAQLKLDQPQVIYGMPDDKSTQLDSATVQNSEKNSWSIMCNSLDVTGGNITLVENKDSSINNLNDWLPVKNFNTRIRDFSASSKRSGLNVDQLSFSLNDKAFLQSLNASVEADAELNGKLSLDLVLSTIVDNTNKFTRGDTVSIEAVIDGSLDYMNISTLLIKTNSGINLDVNGSVSASNVISESRCDLNFQTNTLSKNQTQQIISLFGNALKLPSFKPYTLKGNVSNTFSFPEFNIAVKSGSGNIDLVGKFNTANYYSELDASLSGIMISEIFGEDYPESVTASLTWNGKVGGLSDLTGNGALEISKLKYKDFTSHDFNLGFVIENNLCKFTAIAADTNLACDINGEIGWDNFAYQGRLNGYFEINEGRSNLLPQQIAIESNVAASFLYSKAITKASLKLDTIRVFQSVNKFSVDSIVWNLDSDNDNLHSTFNSDFVNSELQSQSSLDEFIAAMKNVGVEKILSAGSAYFMNATNMPAIPVFDFKTSADYDSIFGIFLPDTVFRFNAVNILAGKSPGEELIKLDFSSDSISYMNAHAFGTKMVITADEKQLSGNLTIDSTKVNGIIGGLTRVKVDVLPDKISGSLFIADSSGTAIYQMGAYAIKGKEQIVFRTDNPEWIINSNKWNLTDPQFLKWEIAKNDFIASLSLHYDQMEIKLLGSTRDTMNLNFKKVQISKLFSTQVVPMLPDGVLDANLNYSDKGKKNLDFNMDVSAMKWKDIFIEHVTANGYLNIDTAGMIESDISAQLNDSSEFRIQLQPNELNSGQNINASFDYVPIKLIEPFTRDYINRLGGYASGTIYFSEENKLPVIDGKFRFKSVTLNVVPLGAWFSIPEDSIVIKSNKIYFNRFEVLDSLQKQLYVDGTIDLKESENIIADLQVNLDDIRVMNTTVKDNPDFYGSVIVNSGLKITGPITKPLIKGNITLQEGTNITYRQENDVSVQETQKIVTFASLTGDSAESDIQISRIREVSGMPAIQTTIEITPKTKFNFVISSGYDIHIGIAGAGLLNYAMLSNNSMIMTGNYEIKQGTAELKFTGWPLKNFTITPGSTLRWDGDVTDPEINLEATTKVEGSYINPVDNKTRYVDFIVSMKLSDQLSKLDIVFSVKSPDQYITSVLNALPEDEQMRQAINLLIFESINLPNIESSSNYLDSQINSFWESQLNSLTKTSFKKVDLSFGVDTYTQTSAGGAEEEKTSLSYEVERKFLHDRASVKISGRFNDDPQAGEQANTVLENFIFEYELDTMKRKFLKLYTKKDYEDILDGEVTKSGVGFIYRKSYPDFKSIWQRKKRAVPVAKQENPQTN